MSLKEMNTPLLALAIHGTFKKEPPVGSYHLEERCNLALHIGKQIERHQHTEVPEANRMGNN
jgi:hypothetical protein